MYNYIVGWADLRRKTLRQRAWRVLNVVVATVTIVNVSAIGLTLRPQSTFAAPPPNPKIDLDQWHNDNAVWHNGNININNSSYHEGEAVPFKLVVTGLGNGVSQTVRIRYDATKATINAYDYLVTYNYSESPSPIPGGSPATASIPADGGLGFIQDAGAFSLWGGTFGTISGPITDVNEKYYDVELIGSGSDLTLLWAGHLSSETDWGVGKGSSSISGAPFHMAASEINGSRESGKQDRSIQPGSILSPSSGTLRVNKIVVGGNATADQFGFRIVGSGGGYSTPTTGEDFVVFSNLTPGSYSVEEDPNHDGYSETSNTCFDVPVVADALSTCMITNTRDMGEVTINKAIIDPENGTAVPSDWTFTLHPTLGGSDITGIQHNTPTNVPTGFYKVFENGPNWYSFISVNGDCNEDGDVYLEVTTEDATCTFYNQTYGIHGQKFSDQNANRFWDQNEPALNGWTIFIDSNSNGQLDQDERSMVTQHDVNLNQDGWYWFKDVKAGTYQICEVAQDGWQQTYPKNSNNNCHTIEIPQDFESEVASCTQEQTPNAVLAPACNFGNQEITEPDLTIEKSNNVATFVNPGATVEYAVTVTNTGNAVAQDITLTDTLPTGFSYVSGSASITPDSVVGQVITWNIGAMNPAEDFTVTYSAKVSASQTAGFNTNTAVAGGENVKEVSAESIVEVRVPVVLGEETEPAISLAKVVEPSVTNPGKTVLFTLVVSSTGTEDAQNVIVTDTLPTGFTFVDGGGNAKSWTFATLAVGEEQIINFEVLVGNDVKAGDYVNTAVALADGVSPIQAQATITVKVPQVLGLATTGVSLRDYTLFGFGLMAIASGFVLLRRSRRELGLES